LTLKDAIERGLLANLRVLVASTRVEEASGARQRRLASLFPRARVETPVTLQNRNLQAFGISSPGVPAVVGPFATYDFRLYVDQPVLDLQSLHGWKASDRFEQASRQDLQDTRDLIIRQIAALYLSAQEAAARAEAAESRVATAQALSKLAQEQGQAGVATGVDVLRAQVQLANEEQNRVATRTAAQQALLTLARNIGLSPGTPLVLAETLEFRAVESPAIQGALASALLARPDYRSLQSQREALVEQQKSARARYLPRISVGGNYGGLGRTLGSIRATGALQGTVSLTLFDRDRQGELQEIESRLKRLDAQMADLRLGIDEEIRQAVLALESAAEEVQVAQAAQGLAQHELELARTRFQSGVTTNIEVITAQEALARALENTIVALSRHTDARMALARALGATEQNYQRYAGKQ
jgi:outer membrane protein TolC